MPKTIGRRAKGLWLSLTLLAVSASAVFGAQSIDKNAAEAAMLTADRAFNDAVASRDLPRFLSLVAEDASFEAAGGRGRDAVAKAWAPLFQDGGPLLTWEPTKAEVLVGGDVGFTQGAWVRRGKDAAGTVVTTRGTYLTVWRKQMDGAWRAIFDTGSAEPYKP
jgi:ketosteroid isomerase-like protein